MPRGTIGDTVDRECSVCGSSFVAKQPKQLYCAARCRLLAWQAKQLRKATEQVVDQLYASARRGSDAVGA